MTLTPSTMLALGTPAPDFALPDITGRKVSLRNAADNAQATVIVFMCNHCPYVKHLKTELSRFARTYQARGVTIIGINSNDVATHPEDGSAQMARDSETFGYVFPYLFDADQSVAKAYHAACTPDFYVFDVNLVLAYRGQFDDSRPGNNKTVNGSDLSAAVDALLYQRPIPSEQTPSIGCNIKWRPGNEPDYFSQQT